MNVFISLNSIPIGWMGDHPFMETGLELRGDSLYLMGITDEEYTYLRLRNAIMFKVRETSESEGDVEFSLPRNVWKTILSK